MLPLYGVPMVGRILERLRRCTLIDEIVLAIPINSIDDELEHLGKKYEYGYSEDRRMMY